MSGRFRLDPKAPAPARAPVPPPPPPPAPKVIAADPPFAPPVPAPGPAPAPGTSRRWMMLGAIAVALLVVGGFAVYVATAEGYPDAYLLDDDEYPPGHSKARLTQSEMDDAGIRSNPGEMDRDALSDDVPTSDEPEEGWTLVLETGSGRVAVFALRYADEETATSAAKEARALCSFAGGAVLRDGDVLVGVLPSNGSRSSARLVADALREKTDDLVTVC